MIYWMGKAMFPLLSSLDTPVRFLEFEDKSNCSLGNTSMFSNFHKRSSPAVNRGRVRKLRVGLEEGRKERRRD